MLLRVLTAARCELVAFLKPFLRQPRKDKRKPRSIPCLRVAEYFRVVDRLRDIFLHIRHHPFGWHLLSINARHATVSLNISLASFRRAISSLVIIALLIVPLVLSPIPGHPIASSLRNPWRVFQQPVSVMISGRRERKSVIEPSQALEGIGLAAFAQHLPVDVSGDAVRVIDVPDVAGLERHPLCQRLIINVTRSHPHLHSSISTLWQ